LEELMSRRLVEHPTYYGEMIWILMMLEQWLTTRTETGTAPLLRKTSD
jgi:asparagine synthase (glutamine-hydrolysing)